MLSLSISFLATSFRISNSDQVINEILSDFSELYCDFHCHDLEQANNVIFGKPKSRNSTKRQLAANFWESGNRYHFVAICFNSHWARSEVFCQSSLKSVDMSSAVGHIAWFYPSLLLISTYWFMAPLASKESFPKP